MTTVATFNILHGMDPSTGRVDLATVAGAIAGLDADVVALQEVDREQRRSCGVDQIAWLAAELGAHGAFAPALLGDPNRAWVPPSGGDPGGPAYGVGILSRHPITQRRSRRLPGGGAGLRSRPERQNMRPGWDHEPRTALTCAIETADGPLSVTVTHLSYLPWRGLAQLRAAIRSAAGSPSVLLGDLNLPAATVRLATPGWDHHPTAATHPAWQPRARIDQILSRGLEVTGARAVQATTSDHLPVVAEVRPAG